VIVYFKLLEDDYDMKNLLIMNELISDDHLQCIAFILQRDPSIVVKGKKLTLDMNR